MPTSKDRARISVIIPTYNESSGIGAMLGFLSPLIGRCEIIFVDGGSSDDTIKRIESFRIWDRPPVFISPKKGRANQMNYGASLAAGEILWFLHADSIPPVAALPQILKVMDSGYKIGCFPMRFNSRHPLMLLTAMLSNMRVRIRKIAFGDQGIFIRKDFFDELGGYAAIPLMEDYRLSIAVKKAGIPIGMASGYIRTSERRYVNNGRLKTIWRMWMLQLRFRRGDDIEEIARAYEDN